MENNIVVVENPACEALTGKIKGAMYNIAKEFVYIGFLLAECDYFQSYLDWGYSSLHEYASHQLGFKKSSTYNFINVCKTFCQPSNALPFSYSMKESYTQFNFSQLVEMLSMNEKQRSQVTPDMTVKQIREVKKSSYDSRRLEEAPVLSAPVEASPVKADFDLLEPNPVELRLLFDDIDDAALFNDAYDGKDLYDVVLDFFEKAGYVIYKKVNN